MEAAKTANTARFTWTIENFSKLNTKKLYSEIFYVGHKWRVLIYPKGNNTDHLSIYLDVADSETLPIGWSRNIEFGLSVINHIDNKSTVKIDTKHQFNARERDWGYLKFMPLSELYHPGRGYLVNDTCMVEVHFPHFRSVELTVEAAKTAASGKGETPKSSSSSSSSSSSQGDIDRRPRVTASGTDAILPQTDTSGPSPASKSSTEVIKTSVPPTTPIVEKETTVNSPRAQTQAHDPEVELPGNSPMGSPLESSSLDDMDAYISKLVSVIEFDSTTEGLVAASIPQSTIDEAKKIFIKMLSWDLSKIPDFSRQFTESISVLSKCSDLKPAQLAELNTLKAEFPTLLKTFQASKHSLKEVDEKMAEKQGTKKSLVEQVKINAFSFQMQRAIHKDLITKEASLQAELANISEKKKSAEKEMKQLHGKMVNLQESRSSVLEEISTLETEKKTAESTLSSVQQKWTELKHTFIEPNN